MGDSPTSAVPGCANCLRLEREVHALREELADLRRQINRNSGNSSIPPSANPPWAPRPKAKKPTGRKPGGQPGHEGHYRQVLPVEEVDEVIEHRPERCGSCGGELEGHGELLDRHQVWELPVRAVTITEHQALACRCKQCGLVSEGAILAVAVASVCFPGRTAQRDDLLCVVADARKPPGGAGVSDRCAGGAAGIGHGHRAGEGIDGGIVRSPSSTGQRVHPESPGQERRRNQDGNGRRIFCGWRRTRRWRCFIWTPAAIAMR